MLKDTATEISSFKTNFDMDIKDKSKEELINELQELLHESDSLKALKGKRAAELIIANKELAFQNEEKEKRAVELIIAKDHS